MPEMPDAKKEAERMFEITSIKLRDSKYHPPYEYALRWNRYPIVVCYGENTLEHRKYELIAQEEKRIRDIQKRTLRAAAERIDTKSMPGSWQATELRRMADELEER